VELNKDSLVLREKELFKDNVYSIYICLRTIENRNDYSIRELKMIRDFYYKYIWEANFDNQRHDEDFIEIVNEFNCRIYDITTGVQMESLSPEIREGLKEEIRKIDEINKELLMKNIENIRKKYFIPKFLVRLNAEGTVMYGRYLAQRILITEEEKHGELYNVKLWYEENPEILETFCGMTKEILEDFFGKNDMAVKWDKKISKDTTKKEKIGKEEFHGIKIIDGKNCGPIYTEPAKLIYRDAGVKAQIYGGNSLDYIREFSELIPYSNEKAMETNRVRNIKTGKYFESMWKIIIYRDKTC
jgi:hypothetical protein